MKKSFFAIGMMLTAALSLTNCTKELDTPTNNQNGSTFELFADSPSTKTTITDFDVAWKGGVDNLTVFHAESGTTTYVKDGSFTVATADAAAGRFTGTLSGSLEAGKSYDWYILYPYISQKTSPTASTDGYVTIGCAKNPGTQTQVGNNSTAHLAGLSFPLYGVVTGVAYNEAPVVTMNHLVSYIEFTVTNNSPAELTVSSIQFDAPQNIIGTYYVNITNPNDIKYSASGNNYVGNSVTLNVTDGEEIPVGGTAKFYIGIKPMSITASGDSPKEISVTVNEYKKKLSLTSDVNFIAGKVKKIGFDFDYDASQHANATYVFNTTAGLTALGIAAPSANNGTVLSGNNYEVNGISASFAKGSASTDIRVWNKSGVYDLRSYSNNSITITAPSGFNVTSIEMTGSKTNGWSSFPSGFDSGVWTGESPSVTLTATGGGNMNTLVVECLKAAAVPTIVNATINDADVHGGVNLTKDIVLSNFDTAPSLTANYDGVVVTAASVDNVTTSGATVTYTLAPNYSSDAAVGTITVSDDAGHEGTITVNQTEAVFTVSRTSIELNANSGATASFTVNSDFDWTIDDSSLDGFTVTPNSFTYAGNRAQSVTITATGNNATASPVELDIFCVTRTGDSQNSDVITVSQRSAKLATPVLTITPDAANTKFTVSWTAITNASKYEYYVLDGNMDEFVSTTQTANASTTSFEVTGITLGEEYYVSVKAIGNNNPWISSDETDEVVKVAAGDKTATFSMKDFFDSDTTLTDGNTYTFGTFDFTFEKHNNSGSKYIDSEEGIRFYQNDKWIIDAGSKKMKSIAFTTYGGKTGPFTASDSGACATSSTVHTWTASSSEGTSTVTLTASGQIRFIEFTITYTD